MNQESTKSTDKLKRFLLRIPVSLLNLLPDCHKQSFMFTAIFFGYSLPNRHSFARHAILHIRGAVEQKRVTIP